MVKQKVKEQPRGDLAFIIGASAWKDFFPTFFPTETVKRYGTDLPQHKFLRRVLPYLALSKTARLYVWSFNEPRYLKTYERWFRNPLGRIEDGFIRSVQLGRMGAVPLSLCMDRRGIYFDPTRPSDLEHIYNTYDFDADPAFMVRAKNGMEALLKSRLSKYNTAKAKNIDDIYGEKTVKRILVVGQVEGDMSIVKGCTPQRVNLDLVKLAREENPDAEIFYKPHPEVIHQTREGQSDPKTAEPYATVLYEDIPLADVFESVDHVYTITSLAGFEALLRGIPVTCLGAPFYSNWGLTDDRQAVDRRKRTLTIEQLFAGAYLLYPVYMDPDKGTPTSFEEAMSLLSKMKEDHDKAAKFANGSDGALDKMIESPIFKDGGDKGANHSVPVMGINLDREPHRWARLSHRANDLGVRVQRIPAIDRLENGMKDVVRDFGSEGTETWARASLGMMCCALSHQKTWKTIQETGAPAAIVLEDDAQLSSKFPNFLTDDLAAMMQRHDLDVVKLECNTTRHSTKCRPYASFLEDLAFCPGAKLYRLQSTLVCAAAYAITPRAIEKINAAYPNLKVPVDHFLFNQSVGSGFGFLKTGFVTPAPVLHDQLDTDSDLLRSRLVKSNDFRASKFERWAKRKSQNLYRARQRFTAPVNRVEVTFEE